MCVSCDLLHFLSSIPAPLVLPLLALENHPSLVALLILHDRGHPPLVPCALFYVIEDVLSLLYVSLYTSGCTCVCVCVCASGSSRFFPLFGEGLHRVSRYTSGMSRPLEYSTFLWLLYHSFVTTPTSSRLRFFSSVPSMFLSFFPFE